ncbi:MAG: glycosyltransferase family 39 protein, partial [Chloroflexi bacterium]|nr:glycosyltransferase family 39 protein [Chloroflexota bacterium]
MRSRIPIVSFRSLALPLILIIGALFRFSFPLWDDGFKTHPDERYIYWIATSIEVPRDPAAFFDLARNSLNPYRWTSQTGDKGVSVPPPSPRHLNSIGQTFPLAIPFISDLLNTPQRNEYNHFLFVGRALSALFDLISIYAIYLIGRRLFDETVALCAAAFTALAVIHIQLSHFGAFDVHLTTFSLLTILFAIRYVQENRKRDLILASAMMGFAVGSKAAGGLLIIPVVISVIRDWRLEIGDWRSSIYNQKSAIKDLSLISFVSFISFAFSNPFSLLEFPVFISQITFQSDMARGEFALPYTNQYINTPTFWYVIEQQVKWLLGLPLTVAAYAGAGGLLGSWVVGWLDGWVVRWFGGSVVRWFGGSVVRWFGVRWFGGSVVNDNAIRNTHHPFGSRLTHYASRLTHYASRLTHYASRLTHHASLIPLLWCLTFFLFTASLQVKYPRYMLPITPLLILCGAWAMITLARRWRVMWIVPAMTLITMALSALAFVTMYAEPHPWVAMSQWMYRNIPQRSIILAEKWDDDLPLKVNTDN